MKEVTELVRPKLTTATQTKQHLGKFIIGTVTGDIHDVGKDIVAFMLDVNDLKYMILA